MRCLTKSVQPDRVYAKYTGAGRARSLFVLALGLIIVSLSCCRQLPDYGKPHFRVDELPSSTVNIPYRSLSISDFQALALPDVLQNYSDKLSAHTAVSIRLSPAAKYTISPHLVDDTKMYLGRVEHFRFEAVMIPERSWWNPDLAEDRHPYVLQHEQIHFAIMQLAAQRLNKKGVDENDDLIVYETSPEKVKSILIARVRTMILESKNRALSEHTAFDKDTSQRHDPQMQKWWYDRVMVQLVHPR